MTTPAADVTGVVGARDLEALVARVAAQARPGEQVEAFASRSQSTSVVAHGGEVESLSVADAAGVGIRVVVDQRQGFAHCGTLDDAAVAATLAEARDNARYAEVDPHAGLAEPDGVDPVVLPFDPQPVASLAVEDKVARAIALEAATRSADRRITGVRAATYGDGIGHAAVATSTGITASDSSASAYLSVSALASDDSGTTAGWSVDAARDPGMLNGDRIAGEAADRAVGLLGAGPVASRRCPVVFEPRLAATVVGLLASSLSGERLAKGRTPFAGRVGEQVAAPCLTLVEDPTDARSLAAETHDGEGLATRRTNLVEAGVLCNFLHNTWTARRLGTTSTASAVRGYRSTPGVGAAALSVVPGSVGHDELVAGVDDGLWVQSLTGLHSGVNLVSGDVSVGVEGFLIRNGELAEPVREVTLASTLQRMLTGIVAVGNDLTWLPGGTGSATLVVDGMALGGS